MIKYGPTTPKISEDRDHVPKGTGFRDVFKEKLTNRKKIENHSTGYQDIYQDFYF